MIVLQAFYDASIGIHEDGSMSPHRRDTDATFAEAEMRKAVLVERMRYSFSEQEGRDTILTPDANGMWICVRSFTGPDAVTTKRLRTDDEMEAMLAAAQTKKPDPDAHPRLISRLRGIAWRLEGIMQGQDEESTMLARKALALTMDALKEASENDK